MIIKRIAGFINTVKTVATYYNYYHTNNCTIIIYDYVARIGLNSA